MTPNRSHDGWKVGEPMEGAATSPPPVARITMPPMVAYTSKVILHDDRTQQRLHLLEQQCRAQEAMLAEKSAQLQQITEAGEPNGQLRIIALEQELKAQEVMMAAKDAQVEKLTELVETAKASMVELGSDADRESQELQQEMQSMKAALEDAQVRLQEADLLREKLKECEQVCEAYASVQSPEADRVMEVLTLRAEAQRLAEQQEKHRLEADQRRQRFEEQLQSARAALRLEGIDLPDLQESEQPGESIETLRERLRLVEEELEAERQSHAQARDSLQECKEVAARLMKERDSTHAELEELTRLATAFKRQAEGEINDQRWFRLVSLLRRDLEAPDGLKDSWSQGVRKWQSLADTLTEKLNQRPTAVFAQELATHCAKGDKALQALEEKWSSQGKQLASLAERALEKLQLAETALEARRGAAEVRSRGDEDPEATLPEKGKVEDLAASLEAERKEVARLQAKLAEAEQTIGQLVVQSIDSPNKARRSSVSSLRSRTRSALM